jgi:glycerol dehydrogenase-like iron-containing ADH family enzyme
MSGTNHVSLVFLQAPEMLIADCSPVRSAPCTGAVTGEGDWSGNTSVAIDVGATKVVNSSSTSSSSSDCEASSSSSSPDPVSR